MKKILGLSIAIVCLITILLFALYSQNQTNSVQDTSADVITTAKGFATQLRFTDINANNLNLGAFKKTADYIASLKLSNPIIRFTISSDDIFPRTNINSDFINCNSKPAVNCNPTMLQNYSDAIIYAKSKGLKIFAVTYVPYFAKLYSNVTSDQASISKKYNLSQYNTIATQAYNILVDKFGDKIDVWNIFNESNIYSFDLHSDISALSATDYNTYLNTLLSVDTNIINTIKKNSKTLKTAVITTDIAGINDINSTSTDSAIVDWKAFLNTMNKSFDMLSFNIYPGQDELYINSLPNLLNSIATKFKKKVAISETGMSTVSINETDQGKYLSYIIEQLSKANLYSIIVYEYQDDNLSWIADDQKHYGAIKLGDGVMNKAGYNYVVGALNGIYLTPRPVSTSIICTTTYSEMFNQASNTALSTTNWGTIFSRNFTVVNKTLTLNKGDYVSSPWIFKGDFNLTVNVNSILPLIDMASGDYGAMSIDLTNTAHTTTYYTFYLQKESFGFSFGLRDLTTGKPDQKYYIGKSIDSVKTFSLVRSGTNLIVKVNGNQVGMISGLGLSNVQTGDLGYDYVITGSSNAEFSVVLSGVSEMKCN